jgi:hypothetical protein
VNESRVREFLTRLQDAGLSARRINLTLLVLKMILRTAARRRLLREDPTERSRPMGGVGARGHVRLVQSVEPVGGGGR